MALLQGLSRPASSCSSPSSSSPPLRYQVFLSFRGKDTRRNFTAHLYKALVRKGINTYIDNNLERGEEISPALLEAIEVSKISIIILSPHYASSTWCLKELMKILDCKETKQQIVLPVFYYVDPSDVRHQTNTFEEAFAKHEGRFKDDKENVQRWKAALTEVSNLSGFHLTKERNESEFIDDIIQWVNKSIISRTSLDVAKYPVGIESRVQGICSHLCVGMNDIRMVGILGCGGIGKTTIAKAIYNLIDNQFEATCFLSNVRETSGGERGLAKLQEMLLSKILEDSDLKVDTEDRGINLIKERICHKKILLILDDVDQLKQLWNLAGDRDWFGSGSRIIITTRDESVLTNHNVDFTYEVERLGWNESLQLFSQNAFKMGSPLEEYKELTEQIINYAGGFPLALQVLGSDLHNKSICEWESALKQYRESPHQDIQKKLRRSYDGLDRNEKNIFLDIACFFMGKKKDDVMKILGICGFLADIGIRKLMEKCLITTTTCWYTDELLLEMHDLLQEMGREVVREESPNEPGERSRLWFYEDVRMVLEDNTGTNKIEAIMVSPKSFGDVIQMSSEAFMKMKRLRLLIFNSGEDGLDVRGEVQSLPNELRVLSWDACHLPLLSNFHGKKLSYLQLIDLKTNERSWARIMRMDFSNLTVLDFSRCWRLRKIPNLSGQSNLEELILFDCRHLEEIDDSVGLLDKLVRFDLRKCSRLSRLPRSIRLRSLEFFGLENCSSLLNFPEIECEIKNLREMDYVWCGIKMLPSSIINISGLRSLTFEYCRELDYLPDSIFQLQHLELLRIDNCPLFGGFGDYEKYTAKYLRMAISEGRKPTARGLEFLSTENSVLSESNHFTNSTWQPLLRQLDILYSGIDSLPVSMKRFVRLRSLFLLFCTDLREIPELPQNIEEVYVQYCTELESFPQASRKLQFDTSDDSLDKLIHLNLCGCDKMLEKLRNPVLSPSLRWDLRGEIPTSLLEDYVLDGIADYRRGLPTWFSDSKNSLNANRCRISVNLQECLEEAITIALCAVIVLRDLNYSTLGELISVSASVVREGRSLRCVEGTTVVFESWYMPAFLFVAYTTVEPSELEGNQLEVEFSASFPSVTTTEIASCEVHRVLEHKERVEARKRKHENKETGRAVDDDVLQMDVSNAEPESKEIARTKDAPRVLCWGNNVQMDVSNLRDLYSMIERYLSSRPQQEAKGGCSSMKATS